MSYGTRKARWLLRGKLGQLRGWQERGNLRLVELADPAALIVDRLLLLFLEQRPLCAIVNLLCVCLVSRPSNHRTFSVIAIATDINLHSNGSKMVHFLFLSPQLIVQSFKFLKSYTGSLFEEGAPALDGSFCVFVNFAFSFSFQFI